ncbi:MAG: hypothetical protein EZS28_045615 [Streblomastix strix]|uniref:Uncharacterized protein n=1 Tax=Streblomastix strix TaxID=222440 RepID=A0A5J4TLN0_9EUKA|nr:MAG: hypothetical protein EZS28_045615 [Streblomastix strix]
MKDNDQKLLPGNMGAFLLDLSQMSEETYQWDDWLDIERITIEEMMKKDAEVILTEVIAFHTRQNNSVASAKSQKACLTTLLSLIQRELTEKGSKFSKINETVKQKSLKFASGQANTIESYEIYETDDEKRYKRQKSTSYKSIDRTEENWASKYSLRHSATTELAKLGVSERDLTIFTRHS